MVIPPRSRGGLGASSASSSGLSELGVEFTRDGERLRLIRCGGASRKRLLQAGERTGAEMVRALRTAVRASGADVWESTRLVELMPEGDGWRAVVAPGGVADPSHLGRPCRGRMTGGQERRAGESRGWRADPVGGRLATP